MDSNHMPAPGMMYQGNFNRREKLRCECGSDLIYYFMRKFSGSDKEVLYIGCTRCKKETPARREDDIRAFKTKNG